MNQKVESHVSIAYNPEHGATMDKMTVWYVISDNWKAGITALTFSGPQQSIFGRYFRNDQLASEVVYRW